MENISELIKRKKELTEQMRVISETAQSECRNLTDEEKADYDFAEVQLEKLFVQLIFVIREIVN